MQNPGKRKVSTDALETLGMIKEIIKKSEYEE
jgi:hypothetical protein